jgi:hypothetical protein
MNQINSHITTKLHLDSFEFTCLQEFLEEDDFSKKLFLAGYIPVEIFNYLKETHENSNYTWTSKEEKSQIFDETLKDISNLAVELGMESWDTRNQLGTHQILTKFKMQIFFTSCFLIHFFCVLIMYFI